KGNFEAKLEVNNISIDLSPFPEQFLARTVAGAVSSLREAENIESLELYLKQGDVTVIVNGNQVELMIFPNDLIASIVVVMVSSLKGVDKIDSLKISVKIS
ncbi:MAG: hypothetical protein WBC55_04135, partial [Dehalococcoidia bacterium]